MFWPAAAALETVALVIERVRSRKDRAWRHRFTIPERHRRRRRQSKCSSLGCFPFLTALGIAGHAFREHLISLLIGCERLLPFQALLLLFIFQPLSLLSLPADDHQVTVDGCFRDAKLVGDLSLRSPFVRERFDRRQQPGVVRIPAAEDQMTFILKINMTKRKKSAISFLDAKGRNVGRVEF